MPTRVVEPEVLENPAVPLTAAEVAVRLRHLERLTKLLDEAFEIPLIRQKVGLDAVIGLVPIAGDTVTALTSAWIVFESHRMGVSRWLLARMTWNVFADWLGGAVPFAGDVFDVLFKANRRNVELLKEHLRQAGYELPTT